LTVTEALAHATSRLSAAGVATPDRDAEALLRHILGWDRARILGDGSAVLPTGALETFTSLVNQRARRRPLQHITGSQAFWHHDFQVTRDVLIPRPETEILVEAALGLLTRCFRPVVVDVGTGSGCIALCLAADQQDALVHATDLSPAALLVARDNARRLRLEDRVHFHEGDLLAPVANLFGRVDLVASNPPYVDLQERNGLAPEVRDHEPAMALFPPGDRYSVYRRLAPEAARALRPGGHLVVEIGAGMHSQVMAILRAEGFDVKAVLSDLQGIARTVVASRVSP
jgi:release factor glutamine methyltransferase